MEHFLDGIAPLMKYFIKTPTKCIISIYVLAEICLQTSKLLGPLFQQTVNY